MNILLINHYAGSIEYGMEFRPYYLAKEWTKTGKNTLIVGANFSHLRKKNPKKIGFEENENVKYYWIETPEYKRNGLTRVVNIFSFVFKLFWKSGEITHRLQPDVIIASSTYPMDIFPAWFIARKHKAKLVFEIHDLWPMSLTDIGGMYKFHPFVLLVKLSEWFTYKIADKVVSILPNTWDHVKKFGVKKDNFSVIENGIYFEKKEEISALPKQHQNKIDELKKQKLFLVGYAGAHGVANALDYLIKAAKKVEKDKVHIVLVGDGQEKQNLINLAKSLEITNITFLNKITKSQVQAFLKQMDALYVGAKKKEIYKYGVSLNKFFDYLLSKKPIISAIESKGNPIEKSKSGFCISAENEDLIAKALIKVKLKNKSELKKLGDIGFQYLKKHHDYKYLASQFLKNL